MTPTPGTPGQEPIGLSERLKQLQAHQDGALPAFDLDAVVRGGRRRRARRTAAAVVTAVASVAAVAALVTVPLTRHTPPAPPATRAPLPSPSATRPSVPVGKFKGVDLRYEQDGSFVNYDYVRDDPTFKGVASLVSGGLAVYKPGGVPANGPSSPVLASVDVSIVRHGSVGTVRITITSSQAVTLSPSDFIWLAPSVEAGPTTTADITVQPGKHIENLTFDGVSKGALSWSLAPTRDFYWATD